VLAHGGEVAARDRPDGGASFEVLIPAGTPPPVHDGPVRSAPRASA
jgi:signal transduction histidine kinase